MTQAAKNRLDQTEATAATKTPRVFAGKCQRNSEHENTRVYKTSGKTRYCVCDDCGETWKQIGPQAGSSS